MLPNLILAPTMPDWLSAANPYIKSFLIALIMICAIAIIVIVLKMDSTGEGAAANSITGASGIQDSFYKKNIASSKEGRLKKLIVIASVAIAVLSVIYFIFFAFIESFS